MERSANRDHILQKYRDQHAIYQRLAERTETLLGTLLPKATQCEVTSRAKSMDSLHGKLDRKEYEQLQDVTDLAALRIITLFSDTVEAVARLVEQEFVIDKDHSKDKPALPPDRFGYVSVHYVCSHTDARLALAEFEEFAGYRFEIQVRSQLQHTWAQIYHGLGYKAEKEIPAEKRRRFSQLAAILEIADREFMALRSELTGFRHELELPMASWSPALDINKDTVAAYVQKSEDLLKIEQAVLARLSIPNHQGFSGHFSFTERPSLVELLVRELTAVKIESVGQLTTALKLNAARIEEYIVHRFAGDYPQALPRGLGLDALATLIVGKTGSQEQMAMYLTAVGRSPDQAYNVLCEVQWIDGHLKSRLDGAK